MAAPTHDGRTPTKPVDRFAHCTFCGARFVSGQAWPRRCGACGETSYQNPAPVAVAVQPVGDGLLVVRRGIPPAVGRLALPGGFLDVGETWQAAVVRELSEETGLTVDAAAVRHYETVSAPDGTLLVFGRLPALADASHLPPSAANEESLGWEILSGPSELAFNLHTLVAQRFFTAG
jgi:ADP-ribose pyrophosphatase YjhB (NUDIX family)